MDSLKRLTPFISVAAQLQPADMGTLAAAGFRSVINNRPDGEGEGSPLLLRCKLQPRPVAWSTIFYR